MLYTRDIQDARKVAFLRFLTCSCPPTGGSVLLVTSKESTSCKSSYQASSSHGGTGVLTEKGSDSAIMVQVQPTLSERKEDGVCVKRPGLAIPIQKCTGRMDGWVCRAPRPHGVVLGQQENTRSPGFHYKETPIHSLPKKKKKALKICLSLLFYPTIPCKPP